MCDDYFDYVGTPEIFKMFGFVEVMPQRWLIDFARVKFDLDWRDANESTGDVVVKFLFPPSERGIALLQEELDLLSSFAMSRDNDPRDSGIPASDWQSLWQYYDALHYALSCAVRQSSNGNMTDDVWKLDENWWVHDGTLTAADNQTLLMCCYYHNGNVFYGLLFTVHRLPSDYSYTLNRRLVFHLISSDAQNQQHMHPILGSSVTAITQQQCH